MDKTVQDQIVATGDHNELLILKDIKSCFKNKTNVMKKAEEVSNNLRKITNYNYYTEQITGILAAYDDKDRLVIMPHLTELVNDLVNQDVHEQAHKVIETWYNQRNELAKSITPAETVSNLRSGGTSPTGKLIQALASIPSDVGISEFMVSDLTFLDQNQDASDKKTIRKWLNAFVDKIKKKKVYTMLEILGEIAKYGSAITTFGFYNRINEESGNTLFGYKFPYTFPIVIGDVPLAHVWEIEVARSGQILKFRATGAVFLANQKGSDDAIRVEFFMLREEQSIYIPILWSLFLWGKGDIKKLSSIPTTSVTKLRSLANTMMVNKDFKEPMIGYRRTIPLITKDIIIPNVYIETFSFEDLVKDGKNVVRCSLMLRTYRKPSQFYNYSIPDTNKMFVGSDPDQNTNMYDMIEFTANTAWRVINYINAFVVENSWKAGSTSFISSDRYNPDLDDVYYNIQAEDVAATVALACYGLKNIGI